MSEQRVAGRELDAKIAERIMGAVWDSWGPDVRQLRLPSGFNAVTAIYGERIVNPACPPYSSDIAAAWTVVEKLNAAQRWPEIQFAPLESGELVWYVALVNPADVQEYATTAPLAICLAALAAMPDKPTGTADADGPVPHNETLTTSGLVSHHREDEPR